MDYIIVKKEGLTVKLQLSDIFYIRTRPDYPSILHFVTDEGIYESYGQLKVLDASIGPSFIRCHRKYLVNLERIKAIDKRSRKVIFDNEDIESIECSRRNLVEVTKTWMSI